MSFSTLAIDAPAGLETADFILRPIAVSDAELDYEAVMESREFLRLWEQSTWPEDDFTVEANRQDMIKAQGWHAAGEAFIYTVMNLDQTECLGCVYVFSPEANWFADASIRSIDAHRLSAHDVMISFWVRKSRLDEGLDRLLLDSLRTWFEDDWSFTAPLFYTNEQFHQQVEMIEKTDLRRRFEARLPGDDGDYLLYA